MLMFYVGGPLHGATEEADQAEGKVHAPTGDRYDAVQLDHNIPHPITGQVQTKLRRIALVHQSLLAAGKPTTQMHEQLRDAVMRWWFSTGEPVDAAQEAAAKRLVAELEKPTWFLAWCDECPQEGPDDMPAGMFDSAAHRARWAMLHNERTGHRIRLTEDSIDGVERSIVDEQEPSK